MPLTQEQNTTNTVKSKNRAGEVYAIEIAGLVMSVLNLNFINIVKATNIFGLIILTWNLVRNELICGY